MIQSLRAHALRGRRAFALSAALLALAPVPSSSADDDACSDADWPEFNHDPSGSRYNAAESTLSPKTVSGLKVKWSFPTPFPVTGTPVVSGDSVYAGDMSGGFYALSRAGQLRWSVQLGNSVTASAIVTDHAVVVGDLGGTVYGLAPKTGAVLWSKRPDAHPLAAIFGSATKVGKYVAIGIASNEEYAAGQAGYQCCSSRGSLVLLDPRTGATVWSAPMVTDADRAQGASGASIWSTPTYDAASNTLFVTTGNNFSQPTTAMSDAIVAVNAKTGAIRWANQRTANDQWTYQFPISPDHPDFDFGDSPQVYRLRGGRKVVGAGQKSGFYHVVDAATGALVNQKQFEVSGSLGGLFADSAVADGVVFANGINWPDASTGGLPVAGDLFALSGDGTTKLWQFTAPSGPVLGGVAVANSVVYFTATFHGRLYALDAKTGAVLAAVPVGVSASGPSISRGQVYVGTGDGLSAGFGAGTFPGSISALGL